MSTTAPTKAPNAWWVAVVAGMASYIDSTTIVSSGIALTIYHATLGVSTAEVGVLSGGLTFAIAVGAIFGGRLGDRFGRRRVFMFTMVLIALGAALLAFTGAFATLLIGTLLVGLGTGADLPVSLATIAETATDANRGKLLSFSQVLWTIGIIAAIVGGTLFGGLGRTGGTLLWVHVLVVAVVVFFLRLTVPETRSWLDARRERETGVQTIRADRANLKALTSARYLVPFLGLIVFYTLTNLSANTGGQFSTYLLVNVAKTSVSLAASIGLYFLPVGIVLSLVYLAIIDTRLRFPAFIVGGVCWVIGTLVIVLFGFSLGTYIVWQVLSTVGGALSFEALMKFWSQKSFPTLLRTTAQGTIIAVARFAAAILATVTPLIAAGGVTVLFVTLTVFNIVGLGVAYLVFRRRDTHNEFGIEAEKDPEAVPAGAGLATPGVA